MTFSTTPHIFTNFNNGRCTALVLQVSVAWREAVSRVEVWRHVALRLANTPRCLGVLRVAPYLRCVTLPSNLPRGLRTALTASAAQVKCGKLNGN